MPTHSLVLTPINGEPRIRDLDLAERLDFGRPRKIRDIIKRNEAHLLKFGGCPTVGRVVEGNKTDEYYLNQKQAIFICMKAETDPAIDVQVEIVRVFDAYLNASVESQPTALVPILSQGERYRSAVLTPETAHALQHVVKALPFNPQHKKTYFVDCQVILQVVVDDILRWRWPCPYAYSFDSSGIAYLLICGKHLLWYLREAPHLAPFFPSPPGFDANKILRDLQLAGLLRPIKKDRPLLDGFRLNTQINIRALQDKEYRWGPSVTLPRRHR